jgi:hypothetical protein
MENIWHSEITNIPGVLGVFVASGRGTVLYNEGLKISSKELEDITLRLLRMSAVFNEPDENVSELELFWKNLFIICKFSNNLLLATVCESPKILSLLRISVNVGLAQLLQDKKIMKEIKNHATDKNMVLRKGNFEDDERALLEKG